MLRKQTTNSNISDSTTFKLDCIMYHAYNSNGRNIYITLPLNGEIEDQNQIS